MAFIDTLAKNIEEINNLQLTENGAIGYKSTGKKLLDMNFNVPKYRKANIDTINADFRDAYNENAVLAILWLFFARDARGGLGERRLFRVVFSEFAKEQPEIATKLLVFIAEYGRWDDLIEATIDTPVWDKTVVIVKEQLHKDIADSSNNKPISLLAKWLPSERTSSQITRKKARLLASAMGMPIKNYNNILVTLRKYLDVVEVKMSAKEWENIDYSAVPSCANVKYNNAFLRNDEERRRAYLESLKKGETKINASVLFPHDIIHKYVSGSWSPRAKAYDEALEQLWKALPEMGGIEDTIVVADGSGSMTCGVDPSSNVTALDVANGLAIYCAEHCKGAYKNKYITFSSRPQLVEFKEGASLHNKIEVALRHNEVANTNIEAVFDIILDTAISSGASQEDIPKNILIISDMEFDFATKMGYGGYGRSYNSPSSALFKKIERRYIEAGYQLPRLVFWNVNSRTGTIPVKENDLGVALVSGFSLSVLKLVTSGELDPYKNLVDVITSERYEPIYKVIKNFS